MRPARYFSIIQLSNSRGEAEKPLRIARTCNHYTTVYPPKKVFITVSIFNTVFTNINLRLMQRCATIPL